MLSKLWNRISEKSAYQQLEEKALMGFNPYGKKMLDYINIYPAFLHEDYTALLFKDFSGQPKHYLINYQMIDGNPVGLAMATEHEGAHFVIAKKFGEKYNIATVPPDAFGIMNRVDELHAYGHESYKLAIDIANGVFTPDQVKDKDLITLGNHLNEFLEIYVDPNKEIRSIDDAREALDRIAAEKILRDPKDVLPEYYYQTSFNNKFMDPIGDRTILLATNMQELLNDKGFSYVRNQMSRPKDYQRRSFGQEEITKMLGINGLDVTVALGSAKMHQFVINMTTLNDEHKNDLVIKGQKFQEFNRN